MMVNISLMIVVSDGSLSPHVQVSLHPHDGNDLLYAGDHARGDGGDRGHDRDHDRYMAIAATANTTHIIPPLYS
ncbi:hypothetical protein P4S72_10335 [Vibrio sp. PP-XX7]